MGCQMNALDSELALGSLMQRGYQLTGDLLNADLVVINTCSVRQHAEDKVYSRLGQLKGGKQKRRDNQIVAVIGCMAERDG
ncbi:MAG: tRNA (N6-isopentenyl adenosine(37)-C2)-methylthiotransferase MiaB, partial [Myxococcales bacterium]|nr:tRNA (N6-isopentenyl adenosine(37)-C2)-methylthiotransferase MiaB [Myxococcales bacterium]